MGGGTKASIMAADCREQGTPYGSAMAKCPVHCGGGAVTAMRKTTQQIQQNRSATDPDGRGRTETVTDRTRSWWSQCSTISPAAPKIGIENQIKGGREKA